MASLHGVGPATQELSQEHEGISEDFSTNKAGVTFPNIIADTGDAEAATIPPEPPTPGYTWLTDDTVYSSEAGDEPSNVPTARDDCPIPYPRFPTFKSDSRAYILGNEIQGARRDLGFKIFVASRVSDGKRFMAHTIQKPEGNLEAEGFTREEIQEACDAFDRTQPILPYASITLMRLFNHPNLIKLIDIVQCSHLREDRDQADYLVWEDCDGGSLARLFSPMENEVYVPDIRMPSSDMSKREQAKIHEGFPEDFCWHVLTSISKALMWLHFGIKERYGEPGQFDIHDEDWHPILHRDINPRNIFFTQPKVRRTRYGKKLEPFGLCKLGGFGKAKVVGSVGSDFAQCERIKPGQYTAKEIAWNEEPYKRSSEIYSLGAIVYQMMVGFPPERSLEFHKMMSWVRRDRYSKALIDLVGACMDDKSVMRPTAKSLFDTCEAATFPRRAREAEEDKRKWKEQEDIKRRLW